MSKTFNIAKKVTLAIILATTSTAFAGNGGGQRPPENTNSLKCLFGFCATPSEEKHKERTLPQSSFGNGGGQRPPETTRGNGGGQRPPSE